jgi:nucleoside-diphosphate-sugar epimerase
MRVLVAGASGVLGRSTLPHLDGHEVVGLTRTGDKPQLLRDLGAQGIVCDVYDYPTLLRVTRRARPQIIVNFLTDLSAGSDEANNRVRCEGAANLLNAAKAANAARLVVESVAFPLHADAARALEQLERSTRGFQPRR